MNPSYSIPSSSDNRFSTRFWRVSLLFGLPTLLSPYPSPLALLFWLMLGIVLNPSAIDLTDLLSVHPEALFSLWWPLISVILLILGLFWDRQLGQGRIRRAPVHPKLLYALAITMNWLPFLWGIVMLFVAIYSGDFIL